MTFRPGRVPIHPEAFSHDLGLRRRRPRQHTDQHLRFIRTLPCLACGKRNNIEATHIRAASALYGKRHPGAGEKPDDRWTVPQCRLCHTAQHQHHAGELAYWGVVGINPFETALALFGCSEDEEAAELVIKMARIQR